MDGDGSAVRMARGHPRPVPPFSALATGAAPSGAIWTAERATGEGVAIGATPFGAQQRIPMQPELVPTRFTLAIDAFDKKDPLVASLRVELHKARSKARVVPVEDRIKSTTAFFERAWKRESVARKDRDGEARLERLRAEAALDVCPPLSQNPAELPIPMLSSNRSETLCKHRYSARRKQARTLAPSLDLVPVNCIVASSSTSTAMDLASAQDRSSRMESLTQSGAHLPVVEPIRPAIVQGTDCEVFEWVKASHPGPAAIQETLIDSLEFDLTRVESVGTTTTQFESVESSLEKVIARDSELARGEPSIQCQRRRLRLTWADEQEVPDSHNERLARVRRQLQRDSVSERQEVAVSSRTIPVVAMDANDSSDGSVQEQPEVVGRHLKTPRTVGRLAACFLEGGSQEFGHRGFGERVRSSPPCDEDCAILLEGHFQDCSQSQFARNSKGSTRAR